MPVIRCYYSSAIVVLQPTEWKILVSAGHRLLLAILLEDQFASSIYERTVSPLRPGHIRITLLLCTMRRPVRRVAR